jgi:hypothetical protein
LAIFEFKFGDGHTGRVLSGRAIERSGGDVCGLHHARGDDERGFLGSASKPRSIVCQLFDLNTTGTVCQWFGFKTTAMVSPDLASKLVVTVFSDLALKLVAMIFSDLTSNPAVMVSPSLTSKLVVSFLVEPQDQGGEGFPDFGLKTGSYDLVIWVSKSPRQFLDLGLKIKQAMFCRLRHKTDERAAAWTRVEI